MENENNIFILNPKNELLLFYNQLEHRWIVPSSLNNITDFIKNITKKYNINFTIESSYNNNYICRATYYCFNSSFIKWFKYYDLVSIPFYDTYKEIIDYIYGNLKLNVILDIDLTLLESIYFSDIPNTAHKHPDHIIRIKNDDCFVWFRPHLIYFLETISKFTNLIYWTAATKEYQEIVLKETGLDKYCQKVYYRDSCSFDGFNYYKDLAQMGFDINKTILIDDNRIHKMKNPYNCFVLKSWTPNYHNSMDDHLFYLKDDELIKIISSLKFFTEHIIHDFYTMEGCFEMMKYNNNFLYYNDDTHSQTHIPTINKKDNDTQTNSD